jgi:hypothetical protein
MMNQLIHNKKGLILGVGTVKLFHYSAYHFIMGIDWVR